MRSLDLLQLGWQMETSAAVVPEDQLQLLALPVDAELDNKLPGACSHSP